MGNLYDNFEKFMIDVILGRRKGKRAFLLSYILSFFSFFYYYIIRLRLLFYNLHLFKKHQLGCIIVSVGNLTVGGTGKTPVVQKLAHDLTQKGRHVGILSRGYKSKTPLGKNRNKPRVVTEGKTIFFDSKHAGDEPFMLAKNLHDVAIIVEKNRIASGCYGLHQMNCDILILDDGFQYFKLERRFDIVLIDSQNPFGNYHLLPRGILREPLAHLIRATHILITKSHSDNSHLYSKIREYNKIAPIIECTHHPLYLKNFITGENISLDCLQGMKAGVISGIASPESFEQTLKELGVFIVESYHTADHHNYSKKEIKSFVSKCLSKQIQYIITTEKDAVRMPRPEHNSITIFYLCIDIVIVEGQVLWDQMIRDLIDPPQLVLGVNTIG